MHLSGLFRVLALWLVVPLAVAQAQSETFTVGFGSCLKQYRPQPVWDAVVRLKPDLFIFGGDNLYADTRDPDSLTRQYREFAANPALDRLREHGSVLAVWDDHDYGENDAGAEYPLRELAQRLFLETFRVPRDSRAWTSPGIYDQHVLDVGGLRVQVLLLDGRSFRSPLRRRGQEPCSSGPYVPNTDPRTTLLGPDQWAWLERQLGQPADLRLLISGIQVIPDRHCWETWGNFPHERQRLFELIRGQRASGVIILSGDRHFAEISRLSPEVVGYPLYELTSSGLNSGSGRDAEPNPYRVSSDTFSRDNFALLTLSGTGAAAVVSLQIRDAAGGVAERLDVPLRELSPRNSMAVSQ